jgi:hypothetical protein
MSLQRTIGYVAVLSLAMIAILTGRPAFSNASRPVRGISNPILAMEVVRNLDEVDAVISDAPSPDREVMRIKQYADFGFIACYATLFVLISLLLMAEGRAIAIAAAAMGVIAGICDVIENIGILRVVDTPLNRTTQAMIDAIRYPSLTKWALASLSIGLLAILLARSKSIGLRIAGVLDVLAALLGLYGLRDNAALQWTGLPMAGGLLVLAILYFRPRWNNVRRRA